jgi:Flp pilus assembly protein TadD
MRRKVLLGLALAVMAAASPACADWSRAESDHFIVYGEGEKSVRSYAVMLEDFDSLLRRLHGRPRDEVAPRKLPVYLVADLGELKRVFPPAREGMAGVYLPALTEVFAVVVRDGASGVYDLNKGDDTVMHEYVHHFMLQYYPSAYPAWLVEGYAEYYMTADLAPTRLVVGGVNRGRAFSLTQPSGWIPMEDVLGKRPSDLKVRDVYSYYAQAWLLTHYILSDPQRHKLLGPYLDAMRGGRDPVVAWKDVYGDDAEGLRRKLRAYMDKTLPAGMLARLGPLNPPMTVTRLSPAANSLILEGQRMKLGVAKGDAPKFLATIRTAAVKSPNDRFSRLILARAETIYGDRVAGEAMLNGLLAANPKDEEALVILGESRLAAGASDESKRAACFAEAAVFFARAFKINPDNPETLHGYAEAKALEPLTDAMVDIRVKAAELAPQVGHLRLDAANALIQIGDPESARTLLTPLAGNPHGGDAAQAAIVLLKAIDGKPAIPAAKTSAKPVAEGDKKASGG